MASSGSGAQAATFERGTRSTTFREAQDDGEDERRQPQPMIHMRSERRRGTGVSSTHTVRHWSANRRLYDPTKPAEAILKKVVPDLAKAILSRLKQEKVNDASDLAGLDKDDLNRLGFSMVERGKVLRWARFLDQFAVEGAPTRSGGVSVASRFLQSSGGESTHQMPDLEAASPAGFRQRSDDDMDEHEDEDEDDSEEEKRKRLAELDKVQAEARFWLDLVDHLGWDTGPRQVPPTPNPDQKDCDEEHVDLDIIEELFDLSVDRMQEVYHGMGPKEDGCISALDLGKGLQNWGLPPIDEVSLKKILDLVDENSDGRLQFVEFTTILSRLLLAKLLLTMKADEQDSDLRADSAPLAVVVDYNSYYGPDRREVYPPGHAHGIGARLDTSRDPHHPKAPEASKVTTIDSEEFFFAHRARAPPESSKLKEEQVIRWVHMQSLRENWLLGLAVKYGLHPLAVEDAVERSPTKFDRFGSHFFMTLEKVFLASNFDGSEKVRIGDTHLSIFCAGQPHFDTIITIAQTDPGVRAKGEANKWAEQVNERIDLLRSRVRERKGNYLLYKIIDQCADELLTVTRACANRMDVLETEGIKQLKQSAKSGAGLWDEITNSKQLIGKLERRVRGLHRVVRRILEDPDLNQNLQGYIEDVQEHLDEAQDDCKKLVDKCDAVLGAFAQEQERQRGRQADQQNNILFVLTIVTAVFTPMTFIAGVYGMNFVDSHNRPTIPELTWKHGYLVFWLCNIAYLVFSGAVLYALFVWPGYWKSSMLDTEADESEKEPLLPKKSRRSRASSRVDRSGVLSEARSEPAESPVSNASHQRSGSPESPAAPLRKRQPQPDDSEEVDCVIL